MQMYDIGVILDVPATAPANSGYDDEPINTEWVRRYVNEHAQDLVVGVEMWYSVRAINSGETVLLTAKLRTLDTIEGGHYDGQPVTAAWIKGYIEGAAEFWLAPGCAKPVHVKVTPSDLPAGLVL